MGLIRNYLTKNVGLTLLDYSKNFRVKHYYNLYLKSLKWSREQIEEYQIQKIKQLLEYAYKNVPFYKKRFNEVGFDYQHFRYLDQLAIIPPLTRSDLQNNFHSLISPKFNLNNCSKGSSSGSTGHPVMYYHDNEAKSANRAAVLFCKFLGEYRLGDKWLNIWGNPTAVNVEWKKISSRLSKFVFNETKFPAYKLNDNKEFDSLYKILLKSRPKHIYGYTNAIYLFAKYAESRSDKIEFIKSVATTAENLHDFQRSIIGNTFGIVYDQYGCSEINGIAAQTVYDNHYSVIDPHVYVEYSDIVDEGRNLRKLIITDMYNHVMPFIRYENGDLAVPEDSIVTRNSILPYKKFKSIDGRVSDIIELPEGGSLVVPSFFGSRMLKNISGIIQYQVVREETNRIKINLITDDNFGSNSRDIIIDTLNEYLPKALKFDLVYNQDLVKSTNGKFKLFIDKTKTYSVA